MALLRDFTVDAKVNERSSQRFRHTPRQLHVYGMTLANQRRAGARSDHALLLGRLHPSGRDPTEIRSQPGRSLL